MPPISRARLLRTSRHVDAAHRHSKHARDRVCAVSIDLSFVRSMRGAVVRRGIPPRDRRIDRSIDRSRQQNISPTDPARAWVVRRITIRDDTPATRGAHDKSAREVRGADADDRCRHVARGDDWWMYGAWVVVGRCGCGGRVGFQVAVMGRVTYDVWAREAIEARARARGGDRWGAMYST